jgi:hypothetical protein
LARSLSNGDLEWDSFDSDAYFEANYRYLHPIDAQIIRIVAGFFHDQQFRGRRRGIDVGTGTNLYPAMLMLPFVNEIVLYERATNNRAWLAEQLRTPAGSWRQFWEVIRDGRPEYERIAAPLEVLADRAVIEEGNVYSLQAGQYDLGTMFFVAESTTNRADEFRRATRLFVDCLVAGAPFAAAFMRHSADVQIGRQFFPVCSIDEDDIAECLAGVAHTDGIHVLPDHHLREGYDGMIVAVGRKK